MKTIWKYALPNDDEFTILMPCDAELLFVATQNETGCLWARVDPEFPGELRHFQLRGTGHAVDWRPKYIGSFMLAGGALVFHLFEDAARPQARAA